MKMSKKMISAMLAAAMCVSLTAPAMAAQDDNTILSQGTSTDNLLENENNPTLIKEMFGLPETRMASNDIITASYSYQLYENEDKGSPSPYYAEADITFEAGSSTYVFDVAGEVDIINLENGLTYLTGPLYGEVTINDTKYQVIAGFNKVLERDGMSLCITMSPDGGQMDEILSFSFGEDVMTSDVLSELVDEQSNGQDETPTISPAATDKGSVTGVISGTSKTGIKEAVKVDSPSKNIVVEVNSYTNNAKSTVAYAYSATVRKIEYSLTRNSGISEIAFLNDGTGSNIMPGDNPNADEILDLIEFGLGLANNPYADLFSDVLIPAIREATVKMYSKQWTGTQGHFYLQFGLGSKSVNFDKVSCDMTYNMVGNGVSSFTARSLIEYAVLGDAGYSYVTTNQVAKQFSTSF